VGDNLQFQIEAIDQASAQLSQVGNNIAGLGSKAKSASDQGSSAFSSFGASLITLNQGLDLLDKGFRGLRTAVTLPLDGFSSLLDTSFDLVRSYDVQIKGVTQLETSMRAAGVFSQELSADFQGFASSMQEVTTVGDEELLPLISRLGAFTGFNEQLKDATKSALDLSAGFGISLESAFSKFIKAAQSGNFEMAEGVSIQLRATDQAGRLAEAIDVVNQRFGGTAEAVAKVGFGPVQQLFNLVGDLRESLGQRIAESPDFQGFIAAAKTAVNEVIQLVDDNALEISTLFGAAFRFAGQAALIFFEGIVKAIDIAVAAVVRLADLIGKLPGVDSISQTVTKDTKFEELSTGQSIDDLGDVFIRRGSDFNDDLFEIGRTILNIGLFADVSSDQVAELANRLQAVADSGDLGDKLNLEDAFDFNADEVIGKLRELEENLRAFENGGSIGAGFKEELDALSSTLEASTIPEKFQQILKNLRTNIAAETATAAKTQAEQAIVEAQKAFQQDVFGGRVDFTPLNAGVDILSKGAAESDKFKSSLEGVDSAARAAGDGVRSMGDDAEASAQKAQNAIDVALGTAVKPAGVGTDAFVGEVEDLVPLFENVRNSLADVGRGLDFSQQVGVVQDLSSNVQDLLSAFGAGGADLALKFAQDLESDLERIGPVTDDTRSKINTLVQAIQQVENVRVSALEEGLQDAETSASDLAQSAQDAGSRVGDGLDEATDSARDATDAVRGLGTEIKNLSSANLNINVSASGGGSTASSDLSDAARDIRDAMTSFSDETSRATDQMRSDLSRAASEIQNAAQSVDDSADQLENAGDALRSAATELSSAARTLQQGGGSRSGGGGSSVDQLSASNSERIQAIEHELLDIRRTLEQIPQSAAGNIFTRPNITRIAEAGSPEAVIPLDDHGAQFLQQVFGLRQGQAGPFSQGPAQITFAPQLDRITLDHSQFQSLLVEFSRQLGDALQNQFAFRR